jgi:PAS domain S-box-containing protein
VDKNKEPLESASRLRQRAEESLHGAPEERPPLAAHEAQRLLHELEVHQLELELQNSELRQSREETEEALEQYTELYDLAPVGYLTLSPEGIIRASNLTGAALLKLERSRLLGRNFLSFIAPKDRSAFLLFLDQVRAGLGRVELELGLAPINEGDTPLYARVEGVSDATRSKCRIAIIDISKRMQAEEELRRNHEHLEWLVGERTRSLQTEITERRRAELAVKELNATLELRVAERTSELQSTIRDLQTFSYSISHDLRTPLRSINSFASVLLEDFSAELNEEGKRLVKSIVQRTVTMGALIDDLLSFSRISRQQLKLQQIDMTVLAREVIATLPDSGNRVAFKVPQLPAARGDRSMIAQVLENLIANAVKFSRKVEQPRVELGSLAGEGEVVYFVKDNGIGFDMKYVDAIFGVFQRLHSSEDFEGTGVGLAIVEQIITKHGGRVWAEGSPGEGATFYFSLPQSEADEAGTPGDRSGQGWTD